MLPCLPVPPFISLLACMFSLVHFPVHSGDHVLLFFWLASLPISQLFRPILHLSTDGCSSTRFSSISHLFFFPPPPLFSIRFLTFCVSSFCTHSFCCLHHHFLESIPLCLCYPYICCSPLLF